MTNSSFTELQEIFEPYWYLQTYPDVSVARVDPWLHFISYGLAEGRRPCLFSAFILENQLWGEQSDKAFTALHELATQQGLNAALAAIILARWYGSVGNWQEVRQLLTVSFLSREALFFFPKQMPWLLAFTAALQLNPANAQELTQRSDWPDDNNKLLAKAMLLPAKQRFWGLNQIWRLAGVQTVHIVDVSSSTKDAVLDRLEPDSLVVVENSVQPLVTVIVPVFNAGSTIETALRSLIQQSWRALEILVVDDGSSDDSAAVVASLSATDHRIRLLQQSNSGAYAARNLALRQAQGDFITTHDADDWSHPQKIELQVKALLNQPSYMASVSHLVRCSDDLEFQRWRLDDGWIYRNVSSLLFRRCVHQRLGFWDRVSVNADTEFYYRVLQAYGTDSILEVFPLVPLALCRVDSRSLSQTSFTHLRTQYAGVRRAYHEAARAWQQNASSLYLTAVPLRRPFAVPERICRGTPEQKRHNQRLLIEQSKLFDADWYVATYPDVAHCNISAAQHYLTIGASANLDPGPQFSTSGYRQKYQLAIDVNPLLHFIAAELDRQALWRPDC